MRMPLKIDDQMFAPCGMNCMVCYKHCYTKKTRQPCSGCMGTDAGKPKHCRSCKIKDCVQQKELTYCYECSDFPCKLIKNLEKSYNKRYSESFVENSRIVKENDIAFLMTAHRKKYRCTKCGGVISLHDKVCSDCQKSV